jgi:hypothetical protein
MEHHRTTDCKIGLKICFFGRHNDLPLRQRNKRKAPSEFGETHDSAFLHDVSLGNLGAFAATL